MGRPSLGGPTSEETTMKRLNKGLLVAILLAIPATAWAGTKLATEGCCPLCEEAGVGKLRPEGAVTPEARAELDAAMARLADGDRGAFAAVFAALRPHVGRLCERMLGRGADADDAAQQALEKVFARASTFRKGQSALPWALAIAAWECRTTLRRRHRARASGDEGVAAAACPLPGPDEALLARELEACVRGALGQLSEQDRATLSATFDAAGGRGGEGASGATLRKRRERALERLRLLWRRIDGDT
jgi:RNA polymerase sigma factor (sigma-70 family)